MDDEIVELFRTAQITAAVHQKNAQLLKKLFENSPKAEFICKLKKIINNTLNVEKGNKYAERVIDFLAHFCLTLKPKQVESSNDTVEYTEHPLLSEIMVHLLETSQLQRDIVRFRSCELINKILDNLVGADVSSDLCDKLEDMLLIRLQDPKNVVRQQAVIALHRLQDPSNPKDAIIPQFMNLMNSDQFAKVRQCCIENIAARKDVIGHIILRTRDIDINVRVAAYKRLSNFAEFLKISDKRRILFSGFLDDSEKVKNLVSTTLMCSWLRYYKDNILDLMKSIRLDADEKDIEKTEILYEDILTAFFRDRPLVVLSQTLSVNEKKLVPTEDLNWEKAAYWRIYVQFLSNNDFEIELEKVLPEFVYFAKYIKEYYTQARKEVTTVEFLEQQFILKQFFLIVKTFDFSDVTSRQCLNSLVCNILENAVLMSDTIEIIISTLEYSITDIDSRSQFVSEIISEIMYPMNSEECQKQELQREFELSQIRVKVNDLLEKQGEAVRQQNYMEAENLKHEIEEAHAILVNLKNRQNLPQQQLKKRTDIPTIIKYLDVAAGLLLSPQVTKLTPSLSALKDDVIQDLLIHDNDNVRAKALRCYVLCCIVDKSCASTGIHIFSTPIFAYQNGEECDTPTLLICIGAVVDLIRMYGSQLMAAPVNEALSESMDEVHERVFAGGTSLTDLIQGLVDLMDDEEYVVQEKAVLGLCQLVLSDRIHSPSLISRLVLKWCNPATEPDDAQRLNPIIGYTLERMPLMTENSAQLEEAVLLTIKTLAYAPKISPLADVNIENIAKFMIALCKTSPEGPHILANLAMTICFEIKDNPRHKINLTYAKMLLMLDIPNDKVIVRDLLAICDQIRDDVTDRTVLNNVVKFISSLNNKDCQNDRIIETIEEGNEEEDLNNLGEDTRNI